VNERSGPPVLTNTEGPPNKISATTKQHQEQGNPPQLQAPPPQVRGFAAPPAGRRRLWAVVVPECCWCGYLHLHRSTGSHGGRRTASCGHDYVVVLAGSRRGRWSR
jgi:hypothetical protein